ncbi:MAG TPA: penicillin acylase family protein, partial [Rugosimonospora sp.]|nr:penicillin acylase family protein [Rugosimonospora sp.]
MRRWFNLTGAVLVAALLLLVSATGTGAIPALGAVLNPGTGVWTDAAGSRLPVDQTITVPGITTHTTIGFDTGGVPHIVAGSDADMFRAIGYAQARFRIFQMDLGRREAAGQLAEVLGEQGLDSDTFELDLGLNRAAQRDWEQMPEDSPGRAALVAFAGGVNAAIDQMTRAGTLPLEFKLLGYTPRPWTPVDSLLIQRLETQALSMDDRPLAFSYVVKGLGKDRFDAWLQAAPQNTQYPYDPGPYQKLPLAPLASPDPAAPQPAGGATPATDPNAPAAGSQGTPTSSPPADMLVSASGDLLSRMGKLPSNAVHGIGNSNVWVISGKLTRSGKPILASDPHLTMTLPSTWFQLTAKSPSYDMSGVTLPGMPVVLIGNNQQVSWGITNSQHPGNFYYLEKTDAAHPDQYFWNGAWRPMTTLHYSVKVKGGQTVDHEVKLTVHGPVVTDQNITASLWWVGTLPSQNLDAALKLVRATNFQQFHEALRGWAVPAENFAYADNAGNIGIVNAGVAPQVASGSPYLPMSGTGESDVIGTVPFEALPITYNPPQGFATAANQREVTADYPYYFGRGYDFFDQGWREAEIVYGLTGKSDITVDQMTQLQQGVGDGVARALAPTVLSMLSGGSLTPTEQKALDLLRGWDYNLDADSSAATLWLRFVTLYVYDVWHPIWELYQVPEPPTAGFAPRTTEGSYIVDALQGLLVNATNNDPTNAIFSPSNLPPRTATDVVRQAFGEAVTELSTKRGADPAGWTYGDKHYVMFTSLLQNTTLDAGPYRFGAN